MWPSLYKVLFVIIKYRFLQYNDQEKYEYFQADEWAAKLFKKLSLAQSVSLIQRHAGKDLWIN